MHNNCDNRTFNTFTLQIFTKQQQKKIKKKNTKTETNSVQQGMQSKPRKFSTGWKWRCCPLKLLSCLWFISQQFGQIFLQKPPVDVFSFWYKNCKHTCIDIATQTQLKVVCTPDPKSVLTSNVHVFWEFDSCQILNTFEHCRDVSSNWVLLKKVNLSRFFCTFCTC